MTKVHGFSKMFFNIVTPIRKRMRSSEEEREIMGREV